LLSEQTQIAPPKLANVGKLVKLRQCNCLSFTNGAKRGRLEIISEILLLCEQSKALTHIMYKTNLNYAQVKRNLKDLTSKGLLIQLENRYITSEKGYEVLYIVADLCDLLKCYDK
jgi:predicted transcriptional regulator